MRRSVGSKPYRSFRVVSVLLAALAVAGCKADDGGTGTTGINNLTAQGWQFFPIPTTGAAPGTVLLLTNDGRAEPFTVVTGVESLESKTAPISTTGTLDVRVASWLEWLFPQASISASAETRRASVLSVNLGETDQVELLIEPLERALREMPAVRDFDTSKGRLVVVSGSRSTDRFTYVVQKTVADQISGGVNVTPANVRAGADANRNAEGNLTIEFNGGRAYRVQFRTYDVELSPGAAGVVDVSLRESTAPVEIPTALLSEPAAGGR